MYLSNHLVMTCRLLHQLIKKENELKHFQVLGMLLICSESEAQKNCWSNMTKFIFLPDTRNLSKKICNYKTDLLLIKRLLAFFSWLCSYLERIQILIWALFFQRVERGG